MQKKRICFILPLVFIAFTVAFIWSNSLANGEQSTAQSGFFSDLFARIFDITRTPFDFLYSHLRKLAHVLEFALLGAEVCLFVWLNFKPRLITLALGVLAGIAVAATDEAIQLTVPGRVGALTDVCIDTLGILLGTLFVSGICLIVTRCRKRKRTA